MMTDIGETDYSVIKNDTKGSKPIIKRESEDKSVESYQKDQYSSPAVTLSPILHFDITYIIWLLTAFQLELEYDPFIGNLQFIK